MPVIKHARHECLPPNGGTWTVWQCPACGRVWELWPDTYWRRVYWRKLWWSITGRI